MLAAITFWGGEGGLDQTIFLPISVLYGDSRPQVSTWEPG